MFCFNIHGFSDVELQVSIRFVLCYNEMLRKSLRYKG
jgi:hypothetical protein